ncbi:Csu type fimbrial protein [Oleomonas cavernae]|nr:spore coat U domain-containing protein [Oleomonas cavernae]
MRSPAGLSTIVAVLAMASTAHADTATAVMTPTMTVAANCIVTASDLDFGAYNPLAPAPGDAATTLQVTCTNTTTYAVKLGLGTGAGATFAQRRMTGLTFTTQTLIYSLYTDAGRSQLWGDGTGGSGTAAGTGSGTAQTLTVYGRIPIGQFPRVDSYKDTVNVTINY